MGRFLLSATVYRGQSGLLVRECAWTTRRNGGHSATGHGLVGLAVGTVGILGRSWRVFHQPSCSNSALGGFMSISAVAHWCEAILSAYGQCVRARLNRTLPADGVVHEYERGGKGSGCS